MDLKNQNINENQPLVSIIITSYNQKKLLYRAVNSCVNQSYNNIEIIIVDDASADGSSELIKEFENNYKNIKGYIQESNIGVTKNRNFGFKIAKGELVTYLDGDDFFYSDKLQKEVEKISQGNYDVVFSNFNFANIDGEILKTWKYSNISNEFFLDKIIKRNFPYKTIFRNELMKVSILKKINYLDEELSLFEDWDFRIRYSFFAKIGFVDSIGSVYTYNEEGLSKVGNRNRKLIDELFKIYNKNKHLLDNIAYSRKMNITSYMDRFFKYEFFNKEEYDFFKTLNFVFILSIKYPFRIKEILYLAMKKFNER